MIRFLLILTRINDALLGREQPADPAVWHKWARHLPVRLVDGQWSDITSFGQLWRRWDGEKWIYLQDEETLEETENHW